MHPSVHHSLPPSDKITTIRRRLKNQNRFRLTALCEFWPVKFIPETRPESHVFSFRSKLVNVYKSPLLSFFLYISITYRSICNKTIINQKNNTVYSSDVYLQTCSYRLSPLGGAKPEERSINKGISQHRLVEGTSECLHESRRAGGPVFGQQKRRLLRN